MKSFDLKGLTIGEGMPKICVPLVSTDMDMLARDAKLADGSPCDLIEWRIDHYIFYVADRIRERRSVCDEQSATIRVRRSADRKSDKLTYELT